MSLTNPNKPVTEQRLSEFYQQILPYLGGMPDILANKFSRADLYSTDEKMIGRWIDGKPIYQKTVNFGHSYSGDYITKTLANLGISNVDIFMDMRGIALGSNGASMPVPESQSANDHFGLYYSASDTSITVYCTSANWKNRDVYITLKYTKTTDSSVEIGVDTDYSTTEKIIGTWVDGKPLYQKTFSGTGTSTNNNTYKIANCSDAFPNLSEIISVSVTGNNTNGYQSSGFYYVDISSGADNYFGVGQRFGSGSQSFNYKVTIQYTKTTD